MLGLGVETDRWRRWHAQLPRTGRALGIDSPHQHEDLLQRGNLELPVEARVGGPQLRDALAHPQYLELGEREVLGEPTLEADTVDRAPGAARGKLAVRGDVRGTADLVFMARDQHAIARHHQVWLDEIRTRLHGEKIGRERVLGHVAARAAMRNDDRDRAHRSVHTSTAADDLLVARPK